MTGGAEEAFGRELTPSGALLEPNYHSSKQDVVGVPVMDIRDATSSAFEERMQAIVGTFFASGSFWLGLERLFTEGAKDPLFLMCLVALVFGLILGWSGYRQAARRVNRLERYCPKASKA